ncbi:hypothetical protein GCM10022379_61020 [Micromonospora maritima]
MSAAGRGIVAEARCTLTVLADKRTTRSGSLDELRDSALAAADRLIELGAIEDDLIGLWSRRRERDLDDVAVEDGLRRIVARLEAGPAPGHVELPSGTTRRSSRRSRGTPPSPPR